MPVYNKKLRNKDTATVNNKMGGRNNNFLLKVPKPNQALVHYLSTKKIGVGKHINTPISDSGARYTFLKKNAPYKNNITATYGIKECLQNVYTSMIVHTTNLDIPGLSTVAMTTDILSNLNSGTLISLGQLLC